MSPPRAVSHLADSRSPKNLSSARVLVSACAPLAGVVLTLLAYWPGYMSGDSLVQLDQARRFQFSDWHPPMMSLVWSGLDAVLPGPGLMLVLQAVLFWGGLWLLLLMLTAPVFAGVATLLIGLTPGLLSIVGTIWKDVHMVGAMLASCGLMLLALRTARRRRLLLGGSLLLMGYAVAVRHNAAPGILPLAFVWLGGIARWEGRRALLLRLGASFGIVAAIFVGTSLAGKVLTRGKSEHIGQIVMWHDLVAASLATQNNLLPYSRMEGDDSAQLELMRTNYSPTTVAHLLFRRPQVIQLVSDRERLGQLRSAWLDAIKREPRVYVEHRLAGFRDLLAFRTEYVGYAFHGGIDPNNLGVEFKPNRLNDWLMEQFRELHHTSIFFRGWVYLALTLLGLGVVVVWRAFPPIVAAMLGSVQLYTAPYLFIGLGPDFRYLWWPVAVALVFVAVLVWRVLPDRIRRGRVATHAAATGEISGAGS